ncbi:7TM diverse intracellular signaling domain-containing protein [Limibacter armeniacum]|uniref:7TM diverse intracellular signaling domain-containing protein n=1 Tax=Limibacter armeniacum TaxID=466084 RepID=UPI002FE56A03
MLNPLSKKQLSGYLFGGVLFLLIGFLVYAMISLSTSSKRTSLLAKKGEVDVTSWNFHQDGPIALNGEWEFYANEFITHEQFQDTDLKPEPDTYASIDKKWHKLLIDGKLMSGHGYATYHLRVKHNDDLPVMGLTIDSFLSSYALYINGKLICHNGKPGKSKKQTIPSYQPLTTSVNLEGEVSDIVIYVSNFHHILGGGSDKIYFGKSEDLHGQRNKVIAVQIFVAGSLMVLGFFFLGMFLFWKDNKSVLYFALFCLVQCYWVIGSNFYLIKGVFPNLPFELTSALEYNAMYLAVFFAVCFYSEAFPTKFSPFIIRVLGTITLLFVIVTTFTDNNTYTHFTTAHNIISVVSILYIISILIYAIVRKSQNALYAFIGMILLFSAAFYILLVHYHVIPAISYFFELSMVGFILSQSFILAHQFASSFKEEEKLKLENQKQAEGMTTLAEELKQQAEELNITNTLLNEQKMEMEIKNNNITAGINAASHIQQSMLVREDVIREEVKDAFVLWQPRNIVSGDFYWFRKTEDKLIIAAVDCTGHGLSGALMSMSASNMLNDIVLERHTYTPDKILYQLQQSVNEQFLHSATYHAGLDAAVCVIDLKENKLHYAGAKCPLIYIQYNELHQIKGDRLSIGRMHGKQQSQFTLHTIDLDTPTTFYIFSDGFQDQFGGDSDKKYSIKRMKGLMAAMHRMPMEKQKHHLLNAFEHWKGDNIQIDDLLVLGISI